MTIKLNENKVREYLIELAKHRRTTGYKELAEHFGQSYTLGHNDPGYIGDVVGKIASDEHKEKRPLISVLVQDKSKKLPGDGFFRLAKDSDLFDGDVKDKDDQKAYTQVELDRVFKFWSGQFDDTDMREIAKHNRDFEASETPEEKERIVIQLERGTIGEKVKVLNEYRCQVCEAMGYHPFGFKKKNGTSYVETHHVIPVKERIPGVLHPSNIITVCANHHRQMHYGMVELHEVTDNYFVFIIDGQEVRIAKVKLTGG